MGQKNVEARKQKAAIDLSIKPPHAEEMNLIHALYLQSKRIQNKNEYARRKTPKGTSSSVVNKEESLLEPPLTSVSNTNKAESLLNVIDDVSLETLIQEGKYIWMKNTMFKNTQLMHAQVIIIYCIVSISDHHNFLLVWFVAI